VPLRNEVSGTDPDGMKFNSAQWFGCLWKLEDEAAPSLTNRF